MSELLNLKEGAEILKVSIFTLRNWIYQGRVSHVRMGRKVMFRREDLESLIRKSVIPAKMGAARVARG